MLILTDKLVALVHLESKKIKNIKLIYSTAYTKYTTTVSSNCLQMKSKEYP